MPPHRKEKQKRNSWKLTATWLLCMLVFIIELFFYTWCRVHTVKMGYAITRANANQRALQTMQNNLKIELEQLKSPARIAKIGKKLGLITPTTEQMITIQ